MSESILEIPELFPLTSGRGLVRIPMEQDVPFTPRVRALVDTPEFQRLRHISQLGLASRVYPGATHTRFEHALGVFHNAVRYLVQLARVPRFVEIVDPHLAEVLLVSALLHDLGHWPFCHPIEEMALPQLPAHEELAAVFLSGDGPLPTVLRQEWNIEPDEVLDVLVARTDSAPLRLIRSILSGPIDVDKMDYLYRDSLHCGVPYGRNFDRHRLMESLVVNSTGDGLAIGSKGRTAAELMVFARYVMFSEVYWHHAVRAATSMFGRAFFELHRSLDLETLFRMTEPETIRTLLGAARGTACEPLLEGLFGPQRILYKRVAEFSDYQHPEIYRRLARRPYPWLVEAASRLAHRLGAEIGTEIHPTQLLIDAPPPHREIEFRVEIHYAGEGVYRPLEQVSPVVETLARRQFDDYVKRVRIFGHPDYAAAMASSPRLLEHLGEVLDELDEQARLSTP